MKMLYILNVASQVNSFCLSSMMAAKCLNIEYHIAGNWGYKDAAEREADERKYGIRIYQVDFERAPLNLKNMTAYRQLKEVVEQEKYDIIHCNTPIGGVLGRLVAKKYKTKCVIYQAHGFHFYKGAPLINWLLYYPVEKWLARYTDVLITINKEDFELAKKKLKLRSKGQVYYVPGVGIDIKQIETLDFNRKAMRVSLGLNLEDIILISAGRLDANKNNETIIHAIAKVPEVKLLLCGEGELKEDLKALADSLGVSDRVFFLGNRTDIMQLYQAADIFVMMSFREGLSRSVMEAMAMGMPCIVSKIRGNVDLIDDECGGYLVPVTGVESLAYAIDNLSSDVSKRAVMAEYNKTRIMDFDVAIAEKRIGRIYSSAIDVSMKGKKS